VWAANAVVSATAAAAEDELKALMEERGAALAVVAKADEKIAAKQAVSERPIDKLKSF
jgi:hypothetical protein